MGDLIDREELLKAIAELTPEDTMRKISFNRCAVWSWNKWDIYELVLNFPAAKMDGDEKNV